MEDRVIAQKGPYALKVEAGKTYAWCRCGRSADQPLCDGAHLGTGMMPTIFEADSAQTVYLCGCKRTKDEPMCDGTHSSL